MGSGKGRAKRAQGIPASKALPRGPQPLIVSPGQQKWHDFVANSELEDVNIHEYYLGHTYPSPTDEGYEKMVTELFADAVEVGAVVIPDELRAEDFTFKMGNK